MDLFYSSNQEIENELSKFEEELERDIENYRNKKLLERKKAEEEERAPETSGVHEIQMSGTLPTLTISCLVS